jgi:hypothetical protein
LIWFELQGRRTDQRMILALFSSSSPLAMHSPITLLPTESEHFHGVKRCRRLVSVSISGSQFDAYCQNAGEMW